MIKPTLALPVLLAALVALPAATGSAAIIYRSNEGWSVEGDPSTVVETSAVAQMKKAEDLEASGNGGQALNAYRGLVRNFPQSVLAPKAQRKVGLLLERSGQYDPAYKAYEVYLTKYPKGDDFDAVVESMFKIAKLFLEGEKKRVLGVKLAPSMQRAEQMFDGIVKKAPYSRWAPLAQFNEGQALEKQQKYPEALVAYQQVVAKYPNDAIADDALYQVGFVRFREYREGSYDRASAQKAREAFEDFIARYPESEKVPQARENLKQLEGGQTKSVLDIAKFYDKTKQYKAAVIYYNDVIKQQPGTPDSEYAKTRIDALKSLVGEDALRSGPEKQETADRALSRRKLAAKVDTVSRPDYVGPPVKIAQQEQQVETAPGRPKLRTSPSQLMPAVEPPLPGAPGSVPEALPQDTGLPVPQ